MTEEAPKVGELLKASNSGIPKPMAAVKGMAKPTHSVAPMPQSPAPDITAGQKLTEHQVEYITTLLPKNMAIL